MEGSESSDHHRGSPIIDCDRGLHHDAGTIVIFIKQTKSHFIGTVGSPSDQRRKGRVITRSGPTYLISIGWPQWSTIPSHRSYAWNFFELWIFIEWTMTGAKIDRAIGSLILPDQIGRQRSIGPHDCGSRSRFDRGPIAHDRG